MKLRLSPVKELALKHGLTIAQPESLKAAKDQDLIRQVAPEIMVVAAYGLILPQAVLDIPSRGCINIHASLLPRWRGAAPIQRAIEAGDSETGITLMRMEAGLDTGAMYVRQAIPILPDDTAASLHDKLAELGARAIVTLLDCMTTGNPSATEQDDSLSTYARKIAKEEAQIDWRCTALEIQRRIRAFNPFPGAFTHLEGKPFKVWQARLSSGSGQAGEILKLDAETLRIACGKDTLDILEVQMSGGKRLPIAAFLAGHKLQIGDRLG